jgi:hypothetical protein
MAVTFNTATDAVPGTPPTPPTCTVRDAAGPTVFPALGSPEPARVSVILVGVTGTYVPAADVAGDALGVAAELTAGTARKPKRSAPATAAAAAGRKRTRHEERVRQDPRSGDPFIRFPPSLSTRVRIWVRINGNVSRFVLLPYTTDPDSPELLPTTSPGPPKANQAKLSLARNPGQAILGCSGGDRRDTWRWPKTAVPALA